MSGDQCRQANFQPIKETVVVRIRIRGVAEPVTIRIRKPLLLASVWDAVLVAILVDKRRASFAFPSIAKAVTVGVPTIGSRVKCGRTFETAVTILVDALRKCRVRKPEERRGQQNPERESKPFRRIALSTDTWLRENGRSFPSPRQPLHHFVTPKSSSMDSR